MLMHIASPTFSLHINFFGFGGGQSLTRASSSLSALTCDMFCCMRACTMSCIESRYRRVVALQFHIGTVSVVLYSSTFHHRCCVVWDPGRSLPFRTSQPVVAVVSSVDVALAGLDCSICRRIRVARRRCVLRDRLFYRSSL